MNARPRDTVAALQHKVNNVTAQKKSEICVEMKSVHMDMEWETRV